MRNLWSGSWLVLLALWSCSTTKYGRWVETSPGEQRFQRYFDPKHPSARYKAEVSIYGKYFSGILFFQFTNDTTCRVAFLTVPGAKLFDMQLTSRTDTVYDCLAQLNRPSVLHTIKKNIRTFLVLDDFEENTRCLRDKDFDGVIWRKYTADQIYHFYQPRGEPITRIELLTRKWRKQVTLTAKDFRGSLPTSVHMRGKYTLTIHLTQL